MFLKHSLTKGNLEDEFYLRQADVVLGNLSGKLVFSLYSTSTVDGDHSSPNFLKRRSTKIRTEVSGKEIIGTISMKFYID